MCLDTVDKEPIVTEGVGYKVVVRYRGKYRSVMWGDHQPLNRWLYDDRDRPIPTGISEYPAGYHLFRRKEDAVRFCPGNIVVRCHFKDVVATGTQVLGVSGPRTKAPVVVARSIKLNLIKEV